MEVTNNLSPRGIRSMKDLKRLGDTQNPPSWITPEFIADCMTDPRTQRKESPQIGEWYYCSRQGEVRKIMSIGGLESQHGDLEGQTGSVLRGGCDIYLPDPGTLNKLRWGKYF